MKRLMVYSHDHSGYGNIQRMLTICERLVHTDPSLSVLVVSGSPMMKHFRISRGLDYIKLPSLPQSAPRSDFYHEEGEKDIANGRLRTDLILSALNHYRPDVFLVDKKPYGAENELKKVLDHLKVHFPETKQVLLLGDIVDSIETTSRIWEESRTHHAIHAFYDLVLLTGSPEMVEASHEYWFPNPVAEKVRFCLDLGALAQITHYVSSVLPGYSERGEKSAQQGPVGLLPGDSSTQGSSALVNV